MYKLFYGRMCRIKKRFSYGTGFVLYAASTATPDPFKFPPSNNTLQLFGPEIQA